MDIILTAIVMILIFSVVIIQYKRTAKIIHEKEISETENRIKQEAGGNGRTPSPAK